MAARTVPTLPTWLSGQKITSTLLNQITTFGNFWANPPMFRMRQTIVQSIPTGTTPTILTMDGLDYDTDSGRAAGTPWSYTIPAGMTGRWQFTVSYESVQAASQKAAYLMKNGSAVTGADEGVLMNGVTGELIVLTVACNAGDVMAPGGTQTSGGALNTSVSPAQSVFEGRLISLASP